MYPSYAAANEALLALCEVIASHLDGFEAAQTSWETVIRNRSNGVVFHASFGGNPVGQRIIICAATPPHATALQRQQLKSRITVTTGKGAEHIAERITGDLMPSYLAVLDDMRSDIERAAQHAIERERLVPLLATLIPDMRIEHFGAETDGSVLLRAGEDGHDTPSAGQFRLRATLGPRTSDLSVQGLESHVIAHAIAAIAAFLDEEGNQTAEIRQPPNTPQV